MLYRSKSNMGLTLLQCFNASRSSMPSLGCHPEGLLLRLPDKGGKVPLLGVTQLTRVATLNAMMPGNTPVLLLLAFMLRRS